MTAALYALRANKSVLVIEKNGFGGQITYSPKVENYPGRIQMSGNEFADALLEQILAQGAEVELENVVDVIDEGETKRVITEEGSEFTCRAVILATGAKHRMLGLDGEAELVGNGISFCAVCDGAFYAGKHVAVIGGGNSALQEANLLAETSGKVTVIQNLSTFTGEQRLQDSLMARNNVETIFSAAVTGFLQVGGSLTGLTYRTEGGAEQTLMVDGVFVAIGLAPDNGNFASLAQLDNYGYFASGEDCRTATPGIFVAGDCRAKRVRQVTTAVADGAVAALAAIEME